MAKSAAMAKSGARTSEPIFFLGQIVMFVVILLAAVSMILMAMVLAWAVYSIATVKKQMVYIDELNAVVEQLNALTYAIHRAYMRNTRRIDATKTALGSTEAKRADLEAKLLELRDNVSRVAADATAASQLGDINNQQLMEVKADYVRTDDFDNVFENRYFSVADAPNANGQAFNLAASEISFGETAGDKAKLQFIGDTVNLGTDVAQLKVTNSGVQYCAPGPGGAVSCQNVVMAAPPPITAVPSLTPGPTSPITAVPSLTPGPTSPITAVPSRTPGPT